MLFRSLFLARRREHPGRSVAANGSVGLELVGLKVDLRLARALAGPFDPEAFRKLCGGGEVLVFSSAAASVELRSRDCLLLEEGAGDIVMTMDRHGKDALSDLLEPMLLADNSAACAAVTRLIEAGAHDSKLQGLALGWLRKLAHRGYEDSFRALSLRLGAVALRHPEKLARLAEGVSEVVALFEKRMAGRRRYSS